MISRTRLKLKLFHILPPWAQNIMVRRGIKKLVDSGRLDAWLNQEDEFEDNSDDGR